MQDLKESKLVDNLIALRMLRLFTVEYTETQAYKLGIINDTGQQLIKMRNFVTNDQSNAYTLLHRLVFRLRGLLEKVPFVKSRLANYAAALLLVREKIVKEEEFFENDDVLLEKLSMAEHRPSYHLAERTIRNAWEDAAANNVGGGNIAGMDADSIGVRVKKKKRKTQIFKVTPETFKRFAKGKKKFERWGKYLNTEDEVEASLYNFARRNPDGMIILQCADTGDQKGIRFNPNGGGAWKKIQRKGKKNMSLKEWLDDSTD
mgnify:CR=1 FL=1|jgi:hypothetical protein|tara:strand:+ start:6149 stop:6931 length:783 start_codon:yes stop_codon:yes gene_type:complete